MNQFLSAAFASGWPGCSVQGVGGQLGEPRLEVMHNLQELLTVTIRSPKSSYLSWHEAFQNGKQCLSMDQWQLSNAFELCQGHAAICAATASSGKFIEGIEGLCSDQAACFPFRAAP